MSRNRSALQPWSVEEDAALVQLHKKKGDRWYAISSQMPGRTSEACEWRWRECLDPGRPWTSDEDALLLDQHRTLGDGAAWADLAARLPARDPSSVQTRVRLMLPNDKPLKRAKTEEALEALTEMGQASSSSSSQASVNLPRPSMSPQSTPVRRLPMDALVPVEQRRLSIWSPASLPYALSPAPGLSNRQSIGFIVTDNSSSEEMAATPGEFAAPTPYGKGSGAMLAVISTPLRWASTGSTPQQLAGDQRSAGDIMTPRRVELGLVPSRSKELQIINSRLDPTNATTKSPFSLQMRQQHLENQRARLAAGPKGGSSSKMTRVTLHGGNSKGSIFAEEALAVIRRNDACPLFDWAERFKEQRRLELQQQASQAKIPELDSPK